MLAAARHLLIGRPMPRRSRGAAWRGVEGAASAGHGVARSRMPTAKTNGWRFLVTATSNRRKKVMGARGHVCTTCAFRARQFLIAVVGVALVLALALALSGLADGFHAEVAETIDAVGATSWVMSGAAHGRVTAFAAFPAADQRAIAEERGECGARLGPALRTSASGQRVGDPCPSRQPSTSIGVRPHGLGDPQAASGHPLAGATGWWSS